MAGEPFLPDVEPLDRVFLCDQWVDMVRVEMLLNTGEIERAVSTALWGSNYAILLSVRDTELSALAVYKPRRGERPLWDSPDGTLYQREFLSYLVSKALGWYLVPPTVIRDGPHGVGSWQLFVEHDPRVTYFSLDDSFVGQLQRFAVFDYLVNNADRKGGHVLLDPRGRLWGIDHGLTFHAAPKLRTVIWEFAGQPVPVSLLTSVDTLRGLLCEESPLLVQLRRFLSEREIAALHKRVERLLSSPFFPFPGAGPSRPWPPV
jgi:uncharacterized repeat protein (TIGR03843 family)